MDMKNHPQTGLFFHYTVTSNGNHIDYKELASYVAGMDPSVKVWTCAEVPCTEAHIREQIGSENLERLILAGEMPGLVKPLFTKCMALEKKDPANVSIVSFSEYGIRKGETDRAKQLLACALNEIPFEIAAMPEEVPVNPATLVIGGGITGIQAALEIAYANFPVYLLEKTGTIGGKMATFDKTFPTLDCAACILTPKMVEVNQQPNIRLMTYSEVTGVSGVPGDYKVKVLKKARKVNVNTCIGCGTCAEKCPASVPSEFDAGTTLRKAIYMPFPQAVPNKYMVDADSCIYLKTGKCKACVKACPVPNCINLDEQDETVEINVGNIIVATGYKPFDAKRVPQYGFGKFPNVVTSLEFERLLNASGPTGGNIHLRSVDKKGNPVFTTDAPQPERIAIVHCVGSRDKNYNKYCSRVCCMYSLKFAHLILDKISDAEVYEYFIDMRSFGKGYEEFYERIREENVNIIRGKTAKVEESKGKLVIRGEDILKAEVIEQEVDMVVLSVGLEPCDETARLAEMLKIPQSEGGWFEESNYNTSSTGTFRGGIFIAGACQGPKDIPDCVAQGSAAAARAIRSVMKGTIPLDVIELPLAQIEKRIKELQPVI
jgi:heterodisulfide reductase subunit A2